MLPLITSCLLLFSGFVLTGLAILILIDLRAARRENDSPRIKRRGF
jgi:hypothetical protein